MTPPDGSVSGVMAAPCEHNFVSDGLRYRHTYTLSGSDARRREYYRFYFCSKCLEHRAEELSFESNSYHKPLPDSTPMTEAEQKAIGGPYKGRW